MPQVWIFLYHKEKNMKKLFALLFLFVIFLGLAGCQDQTPQKTTETSQTFRFEAYRLDQSLIIQKDIPYNQEDEVTLFEVLVTEVNIDYELSQWGAFINGIEGHYPKEYGASYNYNFMLYVNGQMASSGISDLAFEEGLVIVFKEEFSSWLDQIDFQVDQIIYSFIEDHLSYYINNHAVDYYVLSAMALLHQKGYPVIDVTSLTVMPNPQLDSIGGLLRTAVYQQVFKEDVKTTRDKLEDSIADNPWSGINLLTALSIVNSTHHKVGSLIEMVAKTIDFMDPDYVGLAMLSLAKHQEHEKTEAIMNEWIQFIIESQNEKGIDSWGNTNAASTATVIIGLVASGYNPRSDMFSHQGVDLIEALIGFYANGAFSWKKGDPSPDMVFSTPQAFAALVVYKLSRDIWGNPAVDLFNLQ